MPPGPGFSTLGLSPPPWLGLGTPWLGLGMPPEPGLSTLGLSPPPWLGLGTPWLGLGAQPRPGLGTPWLGLDNAATTHKPQAVLDATSQFYGRDNSNIHRAAHTLATRSTALFEAGREKVRKFLGAADAKEIVFVRGTTEAINLVAQSYGRKNIGAGDEIIVSELEHHANIVPWQLLAEQVGATVRVIPINDRGELILEE